LIVVGIMQGVFEKAVGCDSTVEWETSPRGRLEIEVKPAA
jgi:hypothetical protein